VTWVLQAPQPTSKPLYGIDMVSVAEGWAVGDDGDVLHTVDGGASWEHQDAVVDGAWWAVRFLDSLHGWVVGNGARYTDDGGQTWRIASGGGGYAVDFADLSNGWSVTSGGTVYRSTDGGRSWDWIGPVGTTENLSAVDFVSKQRGWVVGAGGTILRTTDGGATWSQQDSPTAAWLSGVSFVSASEGWAAGDDVVLHTTDGGVTWTQQAVPAGTWTFALSFADATHGWAVGEDSVIGTSDGGQTWEMQLRPDDDMWSVDAVDATHAIAVGWSPLILSTADGGQTWQDHVNGPISIVYDMAATDTQHAWAAEAFGQVARTVDGGVNWDRILVGNPYGHFWGIDFATKRIGWMVGDGDQSNNYGVIYKSENGGKNWTLQYATGDLDILYDVDALSRSSAVAVGALGTILYTRDGGLTWREGTRPRYSLLSAVEFSGKTGWVAGNEATVERSTDGGKTWVDRSPRPGYNAAFMDVSFADANNGWVVGFYSDVFHTTDGGLTWTRQFVPGAEDIAFLSVEAISPTLAWISGGPTEAFVAKTTNAGATWTQEQLPSPFQAYAVSSVEFVSADEGWAGGHVGIWKRTA
jgi:photosystem II stability/assembly factor-like uncharacterized protein